MQADTLMQQTDNRIEGRVATYAAHREDWGWQQANALLSWYRANRRILPWREDPTPYHVWLSEIMLQQTRVEAVKAYYARFLETLPDIAALAAAEEDVYLKLWEGLGYYSRVRNLHKAAVMVMEEYGGVMPSTKAELLRLPGIGDYTASAIASIAFGERQVALDGNFLRVWSRMTEYGEDIKTNAAKQDALQFYNILIPDAAVADLLHRENTVPSVQDDQRETGPNAMREGDLHQLELPGTPGEFNQAVMDLGAMICTPNGAPQCGQCPWQADCLAHRDGKELDYPRVAAKKPRPVSNKTVFLIHCHGRIAINKRPARGLLAGLYEFPNAEGFLTRQQAADHVRSLGFEPLRITESVEARHIFTHREWQMRAYEVLVDETIEPPTGPVFLADRKGLDETWSIPSAFAVYKEVVRDQLPE